MNIWTTDDHNIYIDNNMLEWNRRCKRYCWFKMQYGLSLSEHTPATYFGTHWHYGMKNLWGGWVNGKLEKCWDLERAFLSIQGYDTGYEDDGKGKTFGRLKKALLEYSMYEEEDGGESYNLFALENPILTSEEFMSYPLGITINGKEVIYCGVVDKSIYLKEGGTAIIDHKTTSWNRIMDKTWELSPQFIGYCWLFNNKFPVHHTNTFILDLFMMQSKIKNKFMRRTLIMPDWRIEEWHRSAIEEIKDILLNDFITSKSACDDYGGCPFYHLCVQSPEVRMDIADTMYFRDVWDIHGNVPFDQEGFDKFLMQEMEEKEEIPNG